MTGFGRRSRLTPLPRTGPDYPPGLQPGRSPAVLRLEVPVEIPASALNAHATAAQRVGQISARLAL